MPASAHTSFPVPASCWSNAQCEARCFGKPLLVERNRSRNRSWLCRSENWVQWLGSRQRKIGLYKLDLKHNNRVIFLLVMQLWNNIQIPYSKESFCPAGSQLHSADREHPTFTAFYALMRCVIFKTSSVLIAFTWKTEVDGHVLLCVFPLSCFHRVRPKCVCFAGSTKPIIWFQVSLLSLFVSFCSSACLLPPSWGLAVVWKGRPRHGKALSLIRWA